MAGPLVAEAGTRPTIVFTAGVDQAHAFANVLAGYTSAGIRAADGETPRELRRRYLDEFAAGEVQFLINCQLWIEGFDAPHAACIANAAPTKARARYAQQAGRGLRTYPGKADCLLLDFVGNAGRHKLINPIDILGGDSLPADVAKRAKEIAATGKPSADALAQAEAEAVERAKRDAVKLAREAKVRAEIEYRAQQIDPFRMAGMDTGGGGPRATIGQLECLKKLGVETDDMKLPSRHEASDLIDKLTVGRRRQGLCTYKQAKALISRGLPGDRMTFDEARAALDAIASNGWRVTPEIRSRFSKPVHVEMAEAAQ
jgi:superfamily II DNA/RNA helicase